MEDLLKYKSKYRWDFGNNKVESSGGSGEKTSEEVGRGMWPCRRAGLNG